MRLSNAAVLFLAEQESLTKLCLSSNLFVASLILELSILTAGSDNTFTLELSGFVQRVSVLNYVYQDSSEFKNAKTPISTTQELLLHWVDTRWSLIGIQNAWWQWTVWLVRTPHGTELFHCQTGLCTPVMLETFVKLWADHKSKLSLSTPLHSPWCPGNSCDFIAVFLVFKFKWERKSGSTEEMVKSAIYNKCVKCQGKASSVNL